MRLGLFLLCVCLCLPCPSLGADLLLNQTPAKVFFSPRGGAQAAVLRELSAARSSVFVQAYSFTSAPIAQALIAARQRGVKVEIIVDKGQVDHASKADMVSQAGCKVYVDAASGLAHNKVMAIDNETVVTGSFNFTMAAEKENRENLLILRSKALARPYLDNWKENLKNCQEF
jgi:phosphatidylserine/phosphatidylglycerophosphate/cardiolipin synthase-like enzyme